MSTKDRLYELAVERSDIMWIGGVGSESAIRNMEPVFSDSAMKILWVSEDELLAMVRSERLPRPGKRGNRVAWRADEIHPLKDWVEQMRDDGVAIG